MTSEEKLIELETKINAQNELINELFQHSVFQINAIKELTEKNQFLEKHLQSVMEAVSLIGKRII